MNTFFFLSSLLFLFSLSGDVDELELSENELKIVENEVGKRMEPVRRSMEAEAEGAADACWEDEQERGEAAAEEEDAGEERLG